MEATINKLAEDAAGQLSFIQASSNLERLACVLDLPLLHFAICILSSRKENVTYRSICVLADDLGLIMDKTIKLEWHKVANTRTRCLRITQVPLVAVCQLIASSHSCLPALLFTLHLSCRKKAVPEPNGFHFLAKSFYEESANLHGIAQQRNVA